jgi:hypothetical protein
MTPVLLEGAEVTIHHLRRFEGIATLLTRDRGMRLGLGRPLPKGGVTVAEITTTEGVLARGWARCSQLDNFSRSKGRLIATGRALKNLETA